MVPTSDTHTNAATSWTRIMNEENVFVCASMEGVLRAPRGNRLSERCRAAEEGWERRVKLKIKIVCWWHIYVMFSLSFHPTFCQWHFKYFPLFRRVSRTIFRKRKNVLFGFHQLQVAARAKSLETWFPSLERNASDLTAPKSRARRKRRKSRKSQVKASMRTISQTPKIPPEDYRRLQSVNS